MEKGKIFSINLSKTKGATKTPVKAGSLITNYGLNNDIHAGDELKQVSLLSIESIRRQKECARVKTKGVPLKPGDFSENITTEGINLSDISIGDRLKISEHVILEISKTGKECHKYCVVYKKAGSCLMPKESIFAKVIKGGEISKGDNIERLQKDNIVRRK